MEEKLKFCPMCGKKVDTKFNFCMSCGASLSFGNNPYVNAEEKQTDETSAVLASSDNVDENAPATVPAVNSADSESALSGAAEDNIGVQSQPPEELSREELSAKIAEMENSLREAQVPTRVTPIKPKEKTFERKAWLHAVVFCVAVLMLLLAFCPTVSMKVEVFPYSSDKVKFSPVEAIGVFVDSMYSKTDAEILASDYYAEAESVYKEFEEKQTHSFFFFGSSANKAYKKLLRVSLRSDATDIKLTYAVSALISIIYIILCVCLLIRSGFSLLLCLFGKDVSVFGSVRLLSSLAFMIPPLYFSVASMCSFGVVGLIKNFIPGEAGLSWGAVLSFLIAVGAVILVVVCRYKKEGKSGLKKQAKPGLILLTAVVLLVASFAPVISYTALVPPENGGRYEEVNLEVDYSDLAEISSVDKRNYSNLNDFNVRAELVGYFSSLRGLSFIERVFSSEDDRIASEVSDYLILGCGEEGIGDLFIIMFVFNLLSLICIGSIASAMLKRIATGKISNGRVLTSRIFLILFTSINTVLLFILIGIAKINVGQLNLYDNYTVSIGVGAIVVFITSIASVIIPVRDRASEKAKLDKTDVSHVQYMNV